MVWFAATAGTGQFVFRQFVDDFDAWQVGGQRFAFATTFGWGNDFFVRPFADRNPDTFGLIEERDLRRLRIDCLLGLATEQSIEQQLDRFFQIDDLALVYLTLTEHLHKHLLE